MTITTENVEQELAQIKKKMDLIVLLAKELLETSRPELDPLKQTRYICATSFLAPMLQDYEAN